MSKLYVGNIPFTTTNDDLKTFFEDNCGPVADAKVIIDRETGRSRGFAFVTFGSPDDAEKALGMNETEMDGRRLRINEAHERKPRSSGGYNDRGPRRD